MTWQLHCWKVPKHYSPNCLCLNCKKKKLELFRLCSFLSSFYLYMILYGTVGKKKQQKDGQVRTASHSPGHIRKQDGLVGAHSDPTTFCRATAGTSSSDFFFVTCLKCFVTRGSNLSIPIKTLW
ncbi:hypothetical protein PVAP13_5KG488200 [Panicum virgatum]|uniref:Uncharacterized protein n=1 Tax=Panicum virgatum TaxID=38727 RepID=A0A8T0SUY0_PANVG|nr:hypothetical protein PVAP13_5KG488200 [Panicum virgatum]